MLVLSRRAKEVLTIGDDIRLTVLSVKGRTVRIGIEAPEAVKVVRAEARDKGTKAA